MARGKEGERFLFNLITDHYYYRVSTPQPLVTKSRSGNLILDKFRAFTHQKLGRQKEAIKDATKDTTENKEVVHSEAEANVGKKVVEQLHNLVTTGKTSQINVWCQVLKPL